MFSYYKMIMKFCHHPMTKSETAINLDNNSLPLNLSLIPIREEKVYLQDALNNHPLWKTMDFWECAILESIKDELKNQEKYIIYQNINENETYEQYKSIVFGQLAAYSHNMLMFGIDRIIIKEMMEKFAKNHNLGEEKLLELNVDFDIIFFIFFKETYPRI